MRSVLLRPWNWQVAKTLRHFDIAEDEEGVSVLFEGESYKVKDVEVLLADQAYSLDVDEDTAYAAESENITIVKKMLAVEPTALSFANSAGKVTEFIVENDGFRDAYNFTSKHCDFFKNNNLDGDRTKEPVWLICTMWDSRPLN